jgi:hypothetical protein
MRLASFASKKILIDTNIVIASSYFPQAYKPFWKELTAHNILPLISDVVHYEYTRTAHTVAESANRQLILSNLDSNLPTAKVAVTSEMFTLARRIHIISQYLFNGRKVLRTFPKQEDEIRAKTSKNRGMDHLLAAHLFTAPEEIFLATHNCDDFPNEIFPTQAVYPIFHPNQKTAFLSILKLDTAAWLTAVNDFGT